MPVMTVFNQLTLPHQLTVLLLQSDGPHTQDSLVLALADRGVTVAGGPASVHAASQHVPGVEQHSDGTLQLPRRGLAYANLLRHFKHTVGFDVLPDAHAPVNTHLPAEWYSPSPSATLLSDDSPPLEAPVTAAELQEASRLANRILPPGFIRVLALMWLETRGGSGPIRLLVEDLGHSFVHKDVEAIYVSLHTTRAARTDRDTGMVTLQLGHRDHVAARLRFREWATALRERSRIDEMEQARVHAFSQQSAVVRAQAVRAFQEKRHGVVLVLPELGAACGGILDPIRGKSQVYRPADSDRMLADLAALEIVIGLGVQETFDRIKIPTHGKILVDTRLPAQYVTVGRNRRRVHHDDAVAYTLGVAPESRDKLVETWQLDPADWNHSIVEQLDLLLRWYEYGRNHEFVLFGSSATQTVAVEWNLGNLPTLPELVAEAVESERCMEASWRAHPEVFHPVAVTDGPIVWFLDTGHVEVLEPHRLFAMRRTHEVAAEDLPGDNLTVVVTQVHADHVKALRVDDGRPIQVWPAQCRQSLVEGELLDVTTLEVLATGPNRRIVGRVLKRGFDVHRLGLPALNLYPAGEFVPLPEHLVSEGDPVDVFRRPVMLAGRRPAYRMESVLHGPGGVEYAVLLDNAVEAAGKGHYARSAASLQQLLHAELRCLDAHAHLGSLWFNHGGAHGVDVARFRYEAGVRLGLASLPTDFKGTLPWIHVENRALLRCICGMGLALWRQCQFGSAIETLTGLLEMNPADEQGVRYMLPLLAEKIPWSSEGDEWV